jgi:hypothetical protein
MSELYALYIHTHTLCSCLLLCGSVLTETPERRLHPVLLLQIVRPGNVRVHQKVRIVCVK